MMNSEVKQVRNPNASVLLIAVALVVLAALGAILTAPQHISANEAAPQDDQPKGYLRVQARGRVEPLIPLTEGGEYVVDQDDGRVNVIRTTATGVVMHSSTCHNQNCVQQGEVTLENRDSRMLGGMIICLPNEVIVEVLSPEEAGVQADDQNEADLQEGQE